MISFFLTKSCCFQDDVTCSIVGESGNINNLNNLYFGVDLDSCIVYVNRALTEDLSDRQEYTVSYRILP